LLLIFSVHSMVILSSLFYIHFFLSRAPFIQLVATFLPDAHLIHSSSYRHSSPLRPSSSSLNYSITDDVNVCTHVVE
jgi:hypothetical protein